MIDWNKSFNAALLPLKIFVGLGVVSTILGYLVPSIWGLLGILVLIVNAVLVAWAGYLAVKEQKLDMTGGAVSGVIVGVAGAVVNGLVGAIIGTIFQGILALAGAIIGIFFWVVIGVLGGAVLGAIGAYVAAMKK